MGKVLIIAEKKSLGEQIASSFGIKKLSPDGNFFENDEVIVALSQGHLVQIVVPEASERGKTLEDLPIIPAAFSYKANEPTLRLLNQIKKLMARPDVVEVCNGCDPGREGELIGTLIYEYLGGKKKYSRMWANTQTKSGIQEAFLARKPSSDYSGLLDAAKSRSEADWLVGINMTRVLTQLNLRQTGVWRISSGGRVQTPTLAKVVDRELEIRNFVSKDYWEILAKFEAGSSSYVAKWLNTQADHAQSSEDDLSEEEVEAAAEADKHRIFNKSDAEKIVKDCTDQTASSVHDESKNSKTFPPLLFDLTTIQNVASEKYKFSIKKTLELIQSLYEKGYCSYPRSESNVLGEDSVSKVMQTIQNLSNTSYGQFAKKILDAGNWVNPSNKSVFNTAKLEDGHGAIVPTEEIPSSLSEDEQMMYDLIVRRFLAVFYPPAEFNIVTRTTVVAGHTFLARGRVKISSGWQEVYPDMGQSKDTILDALPEGCKPLTKELRVNSNKTMPPKRYTQGRLGEAMKRLKLGTPATRVGVLESLLGGGAKSGREAYLSEQKNYLVPTQSGEDLIAFVRANQSAEIASVEMTQLWEEQLKLMEKNKVARSSFMSDIENWVRNRVQIIQQKALSIPKAEEKIITPCPVDGCGGNVALRVGGKLAACQKDCGFKVWTEISGRKFTEAELKELISTGKLPELSGFVSTKNKKNKFAAKIELDMEDVKNVRVRFVFNDAPKEPIDPNDLPVLDVACPKCSKKLHAHEGMYPVYKCEACDFKLYREIGKRKLNDTEAITLIRDRYLSSRDGFISTKTNKPFSAALRLGDDFKVKYDFEKV